MSKKKKLVIDYHRAAGYGLGRLIQYWLACNHITELQFAVKVGISEGTLSSVMDNNIFPSDKTYRYICAVMHDVPSSILDKAKKASHGSPPDPIEEWLQVMSAAAPTVNKEFERVHNVQVILNDKGKLVGFRKRVRKVRRVGQKAG